MHELDQMVKTNTALLTQPFKMADNREDSAQTELTVAYPTVGVPKTGASYNSSKVARKRQAEFDHATNELFKPYSVPHIISRILTASLREWDQNKMEATSSAPTS